MTTLSVSNDGMTIRLHSDIGGIGRQISGIIGVFVSLAAKGATLWQSAQRAAAASSLSAGN
jgi:hypothetical protein